MNNLTFKDIKNNKECNKKVIKLYNEAFPKEERIPIWLLEKLARKNKAHFYGIYDKEKFIGLIYNIYYKDILFIFYQLLPVEDFEREKGSKPVSLTVYDPSPEEVFDGLIPKYLNGLIYGAIVDSFASEQAARRTAMESASDNAGEMIDNLSLLYNRARQAQITQELTEIVSGSLKK